MTLNKHHLMNMAWQLFVHDIVAATYELHNNRYALALSEDSERALDVAVNFSLRSNIFRNISFCVYTLDDIFSDDLTADLAQVLLDESPRMNHPKILYFLVPLYRQYLDFYRAKL